MSDTPSESGPRAACPGCNVEDLLRFERVLSEISAALVGAQSGEVEQHVKEGLRSIAGFFGVERCTLTEYLPDRREAHTRFSSVSPGLPSIPPMRADELFPWTTQQLAQNRVVVLRHPDGFPPEAAVDRRNAEIGKFTTSLSVPIRVEGAVRFFLTAASLTRDVVWPEELVPRLRLFGEVVANALIRKQREDEIRRLKEASEEENLSLREAVRLQYEHDEIVGKSDALRYVLYKLEQVAQTDMTVLLLGETGVGKELFARAIHRTSRRKERPLLKVDCAALAPSLIESELFGHERGAFTGALAARRGRFEIADGGTVFLDEIGELPRDLQAKLLRVLQEGCVERVGGATPINVNVRIIAATNRDLEAEMREGRFREDLFYRLSAFPLTVPPLRERRADIPVLARHFLELYSARHGRPHLRFPAAALRMMSEYGWPGNVRELENVVERAVITSPGKTLSVPPLSSAVSRDAAKGMLRTLADVEREHLLAVLEKTLWRIEGPAGAAVILGLHPDTLRYRMKKLHIRRPRAASQ